VSMNDDRSPLLDLMNCIVCHQTMNLRRSIRIIRAMTLSIIGANCVATLSGYVYFVEAESRKGRYGFRSLAPDMLRTRGPKQNKR
jgi:hypothetical protein